MQHNMKIKKKRSDNIVNPNTVQPVSSASILKGFTKNLKEKISNKSCKKKCKKCNCCKSFEEILYEARENVKKY